MNIMENMIKRLSILTIHLILIVLLGEIKIWLTIIVI